MWNRVEDFEDEKPNEFEIIAMLNGVSHKEESLVDSIPQSKCDCDEQCSNCQCSK